MNIEEILSVNDWNAIVTELEKDCVSVKNGYPEDRSDTKIKEWQKYFNGNHPVLQDPDRADYINAQGKAIKRARVVLDYPQQIVKTATSMVLGEPADLELNSEKDEKVEELFAMFDQVWKQYANMDTFNMELLWQLMVESKVAEKLYFKDGVASPENIRSMLLCQKQGDEIYAHYNDEKEVDAVMRKYKVTVIENNTFKEVARIDIYTKEKEFTLDENKAVISEISRSNDYMYAIYYDQFIPEWHNVKNLINSQELVASQTRDVNKRIGNPSIVAKGDVKELPDPNEDVKVFKMNAVGNPEKGYTYGDISFLESEGAREAITKEMDKNDAWIYKFSWPDLSFLLREMKAGNLSGTAIKLMFTDALASVALKKTVIKEGFQRRIDIIKEMLFVATKDSGYKELDITLKFNSILPDNISEIITQLADSKNAGITSRNQAVYKNPINKGAEKEVLQEVKEDEADAGSSFI